jgi:hypothetical protein
MASASLVFWLIVLSLPRSQGFAGDRRRGGRGQFIEATTQLGLAEGQPYAGLLGQHPITAIAIDVQHAGEVCGVGHWPLGLAVGRVDIGDARRDPIRPSVGRRREHR